ncbi:MAG: CoA transferase [Pseudomonadota bacterium]|nr:CoA transferase [Pseudomonadota bacterium]
MPGPFDGIRVLDFSTTASGPVAARMLGDRGADIIKSESPNGDEMRKIGNTRNGLNHAFNEHTKQID